MSLSIWKSPKSFEPVHEGFHIAVGGCGRLLGVHYRYAVVYDAHTDKRQRLRERQLNQRRGDIRVHQRLVVAGNRSRCNLRDEVVVEALSQRREKVHLLSQSDVRL